MRRTSFIESFGYAFAGIAHAFISGRNFKVQSGIAILAIVLGIAFAISPIEWAVIALCIGVVLGGECVNTAIEAVVDLVSPDYHELAKVAKDCAAGGVLIASLASVAVAAFIFLPRFMTLFI